MKAKISRDLLKQLRTESKPYWVHDSEDTGFCLRVQPSGVMIYYVRGRVRKGREITLPIGTTAEYTPSQARDEAKDRLAEMRKGIDPIEKPKDEGPITLERFLDGDYKGHAFREMRSAAGTIARLKAAFLDLLEKPLNDITAPTIRQWQNARFLAAVEGAGLDPETAVPHELDRFRATGDRHVACLKSALSYAVRCGHLLSNPLKGERGVKLHQIDPQKHIRPFTADEQKKLFKTIDARESRMRKELEDWNQKRRELGRPQLATPGHFADYVKPLLTLLFATGMRRGEALKLQWRDVDLDRGVLTVRTETAKTKRERTIPLTRSAVEMLGLWKAQCEAPFPEQAVFISSRHGGPLGDIKRVWHGLLKDANLPPLRIHDIRHTTATEALKHTDIRVVQSILGHRQITTTARYLHPDEDEMRKGLEGMEGRSDNITEFANKPKRKS